MSKIVLLHGAWHGAWCYAKLERELKQRGFEVETIDYPGHGLDQTPRSEMSLEAYVNKVAGVLREQTEPVIFAVHSFGGVVGSQAVELVPEKVKALVYIAAILPCDGDAAGNLTTMIPEDPIGEYMRVDNDSFCFIDPAGAKHLFYADCSDEDVKNGAANLTSEPLSVFFTPVNLSAEKFGSMPHYYVHTLQDRTFPIRLQNIWCDRAGMKNRFELDSSHSPFVSMPEKLADILEQVAKEN